MAFTLKVITGNYFDAISDIKWNLEGGTLDERYNAYTLEKHNISLGSSNDISYSSSDTESLLIYFTINNTQKTSWVDVVSLKSGYYSNTYASTALSGTIGSSGYIEISRDTALALSNNGGSYTVNLSEVYGLSKIYQYKTSNLTFNLNYNTDAFTVNTSTNVKDLLTINNGSITSSSTLLKTQTVPIKSTSPIAISSSFVPSATFKSGIKYSQLIKNTDYSNTSLSGTVSTVSSTSGTLTIDLSGINISWLFKGDCYMTIPYQAETFTGVVVPANITRISTHYNNTVTVSYSGRISTWQDSVTSSQNQPCYVSYTIRPKETGSSTGTASFTIDRVYSQQTSTSHISEEVTYTGSSSVIAQRTAETDDGLTETTAIYSITRF